MFRGSSPLARGKRRARLPEGGRFRLIPARAGKTTAASMSASRSSAHPRSRGENRRQPRRTGPRRGSSPLARGKRVFRDLDKHRVGLIPARAGKTPSLRGGCARTRAHPRSRGENIGASVTANGSDGSSPLARGKQGVRLNHVHPSRLIPARAGKTPAGDRRRQRRAAHPRSRGENVTDPRSFRLGPGSSPLARGKPFRPARCGSQSGLIPARAGKTGALLLARTRRSAHPRSRGENQVRALRLAGLSGSSPLARGKRLGGRPLLLLLGLIPARAGKTPMDIPPSRDDAAHPRSRGENCVREGQVLVEGGSSPLARGKPRASTCHVLVMGLIPARAGKTACLL